MSIEFSFVFGEIYHLLSSIGGSVPQRDGSEIVLEQCARVQCWPGHKGNKKKESTKG